MDFSDLTRSGTAPTQIVHSKRATQVHVPAKSSLPIRPVTRAGDSDISEFNADLKFNKVSSGMPGTSVDSELDDDADEDEYEAAMASFQAAIDNWSGQKAIGNSDPSQSTDPPKNKRPESRKTKESGSGSNGGGKKQHLSGLSAYTQNTVPSILMQAQNNNSLRRVSANAKPRESSSRVNRSDMNEMRAVYGANNAALGGGNGAATGGGTSTSQSAARPRTVKSGASRRHNTGGMGPTFDTSGGAAEMTGPGYAAHTAAAQELAAAVHSSSTRHSNRTPDNDNNNDNNNTSNNRPSSGPGSSNNNVTSKSGSGRRGLERTDRSLRPAKVERGRSIEGEEEVALGRRQGSIEKDNLCSSSGSGSGIGPLSPSTIKRKGLNTRQSSDRSRGDSVNDGEPGSVTAATRRSSLGSQNSGGDSGAAVAGAVPAPRRSSLVKQRSEESRKNGSGSGVATDKRRSSSVVSAQESTKKVGDEDDNDIDELSFDNEDYLNQNNHTVASRNIAQGSHVASNRVHMASRNESTSALDFIQDCDDLSSSMLDEHFEAVTSNINMLNKQQHIHGVGKTNSHGTNTTSPRLNIQQTASSPGLDVVSHGDYFSGYRIEQQQQQRPIATSAKATKSASSCENNESGERDKDNNGERGIIRPQSRKLYLGSPKAVGSSSAKTGGGGGGANSHQNNGVISTSNNSTSKGTRKATPWSASASSTHYRPSAAPSHANAASISTGDATTYGESGDMTTMTHRTSPSSPGNRGGHLTLKRMTSLPRMGTGALLDGQDDDEAGDDAALNLINDRPPSRQSSAFPVHLAGNKSKVTAADDDWSDDVVNSSSSSHIRDDVMMSGCSNKTPSPTAHLLTPGGSSGNNGSPRHIISPTQHELSGVSSSSQKVGAAAAAVEDSAATMFMKASKQDLSNKSSARGSPIISHASKRTMSPSPTIVLARPTAESPALKSNSNENEAASTALSSTAAAAVNEAQLLHRPPSRNRMGTVSSSSRLTGAARNGSTENVSACRAGSSSTQYYDSHDDGFDQLDISNNANVPLLPFKVHINYGNLATNDGSFLAGGSGLTARAPGTAPALLGGGGGEKSGGGSSSGLGDWEKVENMSSSGGKAVPLNNIRGQQLLSSSPSSGGASLMTASAAGAGGAVPGPFPMGSQRSSFRRSQTAGNFTNSNNNVGGGGGRSDSTAGYSAAAMASAAAAVTAAENSFGSSRASLSDGNSNSNREKSFMYQGGNSDITISSSSTSLIHLGVPSTAPSNNRITKPMTDTTSPRVIARKAVTGSGTNSNDGGWTNLHTEHQGVHHEFIYRNTSSPSIHNYDNDDDDDDADSDCQTVLTEEGSPGGVGTAEDEHGNCMGERSYTLESSLGEDFLNLFARDFSSR